jgi:flagellar motor switch protein FliG
MPETMELRDEQKIAILLASLDERVAASILQQLDPEVMTRVADAIRSLGIVPGKVRSKAIAECVRGIVEMGQVVQGDEKTVNSLLARAIGEKRASALLQERPVSRGQAFQKIARAPLEELAAILQHEQPAVAGVVLRYLPAERAADILALLPSDIRRRAIVFLCSSEAPAPDLLERIERFLESKIDPDKKTGQKDDDAADKLEAVAGIIQHVDKSVEEDLLAAIDETSEEIGKEIRDRLFTFEDIVKLSDAAVRRLLQEVDTGLLSVALRNASIALREKFFKNMSKRATEGLKEEMEFSQKMKISEIREKQREVVAVIRTLEAEGQIATGAGGEDEYV